MNGGNIYLIESQSRQELATTFMRFQEYYESPEFKGRVFSVEDFVHWYASQNGGFSYHQDWAGFNIPSWALEPFRNGEFEPLTLREQKLIDFCGSVDENSYIIGVTPSAEYFKETIQHEFIHGAFYTNSEYRNEIIGCVRDFNIKPVYKGLAKMGYCDDVLIDETNAYILVEPETIQEYSSLGNTKKLREQLDHIFDKFFGFSVLKTEISALLARTNKIVI